MFTYVAIIYTHNNTRIENNIVEQADSLPIAVIETKTGLFFSNNLWTKTPSSNAAGTGDVIGDPRLVKSGPTGPGLLTSEWFKILANSPAINKAKVISEVTEDFFRTGRGLAPDIGAYEYALTDTTSPKPPTGLRIY